MYRLTAKTTPRLRARDGSQPEGVLRRNMTQRMYSGVGIGVCRRNRSWTTSVPNATGLGRQRTVSTGMLSKAAATAPPRVFSFLPQVMVSGLRSMIQVLLATTGRPFPTRTATTRGTSTSVRSVITRAVTTASTDSLFVLSKGSPNSERSERIRFFNSVGCFTVA